MKIVPTFLAAFISFFLVEISAQEIQFFGAAGKNDACFKTILLNDGSQLVAGMVDNDAAIYKFDCQGKPVGFFHKDMTINNSFEAFHDALELPNGEILAVGTAKSFAPNVNQVAIVRLAADLTEIKFDTLKINGLNAEGRAIVRDPFFNKIYIAGVAVTTDFGDVFWQQIDPATLQTIGTATLFSDGIDEISRVNYMSDGNILIAGHSVAGNVFNAEADLTNRAYCRKIKPDGSLVWHYKIEQTLKNKFGRVRFADATENIATGNICLAGQAAGGDTASNTLDLMFKLLSTNGTEISSAVFEKPGAQHVYQSAKSFDGSDFYVAIGDSTGILGGTPTFLSAAALETAGTLLPAVYELNPDLVGFSPRSFNFRPYNYFHLAGVFENPPGGANNLDLFYATTDAFSAEIALVGNQLEAYPNDIVQFQFQWLFQNMPIAGANFNAFTPTQNGEYQVVITSVWGCSDVSDVFTVGGIIAAEEPDWLGGTRIQPNPTDGFLKINFPGNGPKTGQVRLFDLTGRVLGNWEMDGEKELSIDLSERPAGLYFLTFNDGDSVGTRQVVVF